MTQLFSEGEAALKRLQSSKNLIPEVIALRYNNPGLVSQVNELASLQAANGSTTQRIKAIIDLTQPPALEKKSTNIWGI